MNCLLVYNNFISKTKETAQNFSLYLQKAGIETQFADAAANQVIEHTIDVIVVFGGDGTIIRVASQYAHRGIPVLGINMGTIGFLSSLETYEIEQYLPQFLSGDYCLDERMMLEVNITKDNQLVNRYLSLNEVCIKSPGAHMIKLGIEIDGSFHSEYRGDGILVATPTGSTAYSLSAGGPVIDPDLDVILITPLLPYLLSKKPLVLAGDKQVNLFSYQDSRPLVSIDGQFSTLLQEGHQLKIRRSDYRFKIINLKRRDFFSSVDYRLGQNGYLDR